MSATRTIHTPATATPAPRPARAASAAVPLAALAAAGASLLAWLLVDPHTPDLAAAAYRLDLFRRAGYVVWDGNWYAGHHVPGYSLLFEPLAALAGLRAVAVIAVLASSLLFALIARRRFAPPAGVVASVAFALGASGDAWLGRITFALGVTLGVAAVLAALHRRLALTALLAALCAAASPVAGLFLVLAGAAHALATRTLTRGLALALPALGVAAAMALAFPEGGREPFPASSFVAALAVALAFAALMPRRERVLHTAALLYLLAVLASLLVPGPMGSNVDRLAALLALPLLIGVRLPELLARPRAAVRLAGAVVVALALATWVAWGPVREYEKVHSDPSVTAAYYAPVTEYLAAHLPLGARVEVPLTRSHWEAALLGERFALARGWERQLDTRYDGLYFGGALTAARYVAWLRANAVRYVALPDVALDTSSRAEARLLRAGVPALRPVLQTAHWRVWELAGAAPLVRGPGTLVALGRSGFTLRALAPGTFTLQIHYTRYWTVAAGRACVGRAPGDWTRVRAFAPGVVRVNASFSLGRALGLGGGCPD